ncbi:hypothetical protein ACU4GD_42990 [Cupriavidus basilensis]
MASVPAVPLTVQQATLAQWRHYSRGGECAHLPKPFMTPPYAVACSKLRWPAARLVCAVPQLSVLVLEQRRASRGRAGRCGAVERADRAVARLSLDDDGLAA